MASGTRRAYDENNFLSLRKIREFELQELFTDAMTHNLPFSASTRRGR